MPSLLISEALSGPAVDALKQEFRVVVEPELWRDAERLRATIPEFDALLVRNQTRVTAEVLRAGRSLQVVGRAGVGLDNVDVEAASAAGIVVTFAPGDSANAVAELALGLMLALARRVPAAAEDTRAGNWNRARFTGIELDGRTLGILGCGRIGLRTARLCGALGMSVLGYDPYLKADNPALKELGIELLPLDDVLARADFISCHLPETKETRGIIGEKTLARVKPGSYLVNTARGGIVDEAALCEALKAGRLAGAALDVRTEEPPREPGPLAGLPQVILLPHIGAFTREAQDRVLATVCRDIRAVLRGEAAANAANFDRPRKRNEEGQGPTEVKGQR